MAQTKQNIVATDRITEIMISEIQSWSTRYPSGTTFIPADHQDMSIMLKQELQEERHKPICLVFDNGNEIYLTPKGQTEWDVTPRSADAAGSRAVA